MARFVDPAGRTCFTGRCGATLLLIMLCLTTAIPSSAADEPVDPFKDLKDRIRMAEVAARSGPTEASRERAALAADELADSLVEKAKSSELWKEVGFDLYYMSRFRHLCELWEGRTDDLASLLDPWQASVHLFYLSSARRLTQDWNGTLEVLEKMDEVAAREGLAPDYRGACLGAAVSERVRYLLEIGEVLAARELLPAYEEALQLYPNPRVRVDLMVRVHKSNGNPRAALAEIEAYLGEDEERTLDPNLRFFYGMSGLRLARLDGEDTEFWVDDLRDALETIEVHNRERVQAAFELLDAYLDAGDHESARWCLDDMRRTLLPLRSGNGEETGNRDEVLVAAIAAYLAVKLEADRTELEQRSQELDTAFARLMEWFSSRPTDETGSPIGFYDRENVVFGAMIDILSELHGDHGLETALERIATEQALSSLNQQIGATGCTVDEVRQELLVDETHGVLLLQRVPGQAGGCRVIGLDREHIRSASVGDIEEWRRWTRSLIEELRFPGSLEKRWTDLSEASLQRVLPPTIREMFDRWQKVTLVGFDGELWFPFECFVQDGELIGTVKEIDHLASLPLGVRLSRRQAAKPPRHDERMLLVAAPAHSEAALREYADLKPLTFTDGQIQSLIDPFPQDSVLVLQGEHATLDELESQTEPSSILHLLVHGIPATAEQRLSGILLGSRDPERTGVLLPDDVPELPVATVVLSSCGTGGGLPRPMEGGLNNLAGAFFRNGASVVVFSHEQLPADPTVDLMAIVTRALACGATPAAAMREARSELVKAGIRDPRAHSTLRVWGVGHRSTVSAEFAERARARLATNADGRGPFDMRILITVVIVVVVGAVLLVRRSTPRGSTASGPA